MGYTTQPELFIMKTACKPSWCSWGQIHRALNHRPHVGQPENEPNSVTFLPFVQPIFNWISRVLVWHNIKSVDFPHIKLSSLLCPVKDNPKLRKPGVYKTPCECGRVYIAQTGHSVDVRLKEHQHIRLEHPDKSAVAEHCINQGHRILFHHASILNTSARYMDRIVREATEVVLHPFNMNKEDGFCLSRLWKYFICSLKHSGYKVSST
jgi:hypothetical protein